MSPSSPSIVATRRLYGAPTLDPRVRTDSNGRVQKVTDYDAARELSASVLELTVGDTEYKCFKWPDATTQFTSTQLEGLVFNTPTELVNEEKKSKLTAVCHESG